MTSADEDEQLVEDCEHRESRLTEWERTFIADMRGLLDAGKTLTRGQRDKLNDVWDKATEKG